jgi:hypothetical protein
MTDQEIMIHVRFSPDGTVVEIGERPAQLSPQAWFNRLSDEAAASYQPFSGGRGVFRIARAELDLLKAGKAA